MNAGYLQVQCGCGRAYRVKPAAIGRSVKCPNCKTPNLVTKKTGQVKEERPTEELKMQEPLDAEGTLSSLLPGNLDTTKTNNKNPKSETNKKTDSVSVPKWVLVGVGIVVSFLAGWFASKEHTKYQLHSAFEQIGESLEGMSSENTKEARKEALLRSSMAPHSDFVSDVSVKGSVAIYQTTEEFAELPLPLRSKFEAALQKMWDAIDSPDDDSHQSKIEIR